MSSSAGAAAARNTSIDVSAKVELPQPRTSSLRGGPHNHIPTINIHECVTLPPFPGTSCFTLLPPAPLQQALYMDGGLGVQVQGSKGLWFGVFSTLLPPALLQQSP
eukprot:scaffold3080_cov38-Tisochrysis_lutea.AAC.5